MSRRRKLGKTLAGPIDEFYINKNLDRLVLIEVDNAAAQKTRAAALMHIGRNDMGLTTSVKENEIWIMRDKDILEESVIVDLR